VNTYRVDSYRTLFRQTTHDVGFKTLRIPRANIPRLLRFSTEPRHVWLLMQSVAILSDWHSTATLAKSNRFFPPQRRKVSKVEQGRLRDILIKNSKNFLWSPLKSYNKVETLTLYPFDSFLLRASSLCIGLFTPGFQLFQSWNQDQWLVAYSDQFSRSLRHAVSFAAVIRVVTQRSSPTGCIRALHSFPQIDQ